MLRVLHWLSLVSCLLTPLLAIHLPHKTRMKISLHSIDDGLACTVTEMDHWNSATDRNQPLDVELVFNDRVHTSEYCPISDEPIKGAKESNTFGVSPFNSKEEVFEKYISSCPEEGEEKLNIISIGDEKYWEGIRENRSRAADFLIVDAHSSIDTSRDILINRGILKSNKVKPFGDFIANFLISEDGRIMETIGWDYFNYVFNGGLGPNALILRFTKKEGDAAPSDAAIKTFREFVRTAICSERLSPQFRLIPYFLISDDRRLKNDTFERKEMREWNRYQDKLDFLFPTGSSEERTLPLVSREEWSGTKSKDFNDVPPPAKFIVIKQVGARCFFYCKQYMQVFDRTRSNANGEKTHKYASSLLNFIVAEDGRAYEDQGWDMRKGGSYARKNVIEVGLFGKFYHYRPHKRSIHAIERLIEEGLRLGKISPQYKIISMIKGFTTKT